MDSKSIGLCPQGFKSPRCRNACFTIFEQVDSRLVRVGAAVTDPVSLPPLPRLSPPSLSSPSPSPHPWQSPRRLCRRPCCHLRPARRRCLAAAMPARRRHRPATADAVARVAMRGGVSFRSAIAAQVSARASATQLSSHASSAQQHETAVLQTRLIRRRSK